jgi:hypothetical protein
MHLYSHCCCARDLLQATGVLGYFEVQLQQGKAENMTSFLRISLEPKDLSSFWFCWRCIGIPPDINPQLICSSFAGKSTKIEANVTYKYTTYTSGILESKIPYGCLIFHLLIVFVEKEEVFSSLKLCPLCQMRSVRYWCCSWPVADQGNKFVWQDENVFLFNIHSIDTGDKISIEVSNMGVLIGICEWVNFCKLKFHRLIPNAFIFCNCRKKLMLTNLKDSVLHAFLGFLLKLHVIAGFRWPWTARPRTRINCT